MCPGQSLHCLALYSSRFVSSDRSRLFSLHHGPVPVDGELLAYLRIFSMNHGNLFVTALRRLPDKYFTMILKCASLFVIITLTLYIVASCFNVPQNSTDFGIPH